MIKTKASILKNATEVQVIKFEEKRRKPKVNQPKFLKTDPKEEEKSQSDEEFDAIFGDGPRKRKKEDTNQFSFQKARREIINYAIAGFEKKSEKLDAQVQLAIKLGAKRPKNPCRNYKEILEEKKKEKLEEAKVDKRNIFGASKTLQLHNQKRHKRDEGLLKRYGKVEKNDRQKNTSKKRKR